VDMEQKNFFSFSNGTTIRLERDYDNFDRRYTQQVMGVVVSAENIPSDAFVLFHHNSLHETYQIHNHSQLSGEEIASGVKLFSIMERDIFFWKLPQENEWHPAKSFATALRIFTTYEGLIEGVKPELIKDVLWVTSGNYKNLAVRTVKASDYETVFRDPTTGRDKRMIRFRPDGCEEEGREPEVICVMGEITKKILNNELLIGLSQSDCKPLK